MDIPSIITIAALVLNVIVLGIVAYQTYLNRKSMLLAKQSIDENRKTRQIGMLPRAGFVLEAQYFLNKWRRQLDELKKEIEEALRTKDDEAIKVISEKAITTPKGLISKSFYQKASSWLAEVLVAGAQYYYDCHAPMGDLWRKKDQKPFWELASDLINHFEKSSNRISELLNYIDQVVPDAYAEAPASLGDSDFLSDD
jgi:hypothetical protein